MNTLKHILAQFILIFSALTGGYICAKLGAEPSFWKDYDLLQAMTLLFVNCGCIAGGLVIITLLFPSEKLYIYDNFYEKYKVIIVATSKKEALKKLEIELPGVPINGALLQRTNEKVIVGKYEA